MTKMASIFRCDACGAIYEPYEREDCEAGNILLRKRLPNGTPLALIGFDLCPACMDKVIKILFPHKGDSK